MVRMVTKYLLPTLCLLALAICVPQAKAGVIDFQCPATGCTGKIVAGVSSGVTAVDISGPYSDTLVFSVSLNLNVGTISLSDGLGDNFAGTFTPTSGSSFGGTTSYSLNVTWTTVPASADLGSPSGLGVTQLTFQTKGGKVVSEDVNIQPTPEPASLLLLGTGLLGLGAFARRRLIG